MNFPQFLYTYFPADKGLEFLESLKFRLSPFSGFNDPFESLFKTEYPYFFLSYDENSNDKIIGERIEKMKAVKFPNATIIENKSKGLVNLIKNIRIGCLSETHDNILMWGHYCRKFTGIVVKFRGSLSDWGNDLKKVNYEDERIAIDSFDTSVVGSANDERRLLTSKSKIWEYEKEWRCIKLTKECPNDEHGCYKLMDKDSVLEVIVGCRICPIDLAKIKDLVKSRFGSRVPIKVILPSTNCFTLESWDLNKVDFALQWNKIREENKKNVTVSQK